VRQLKLTLAYDGTRYVGWQRQAEGESIQALLEDALARFEGARVVVHGAGRTDAGVHAIGQVASVSVGFTHDLSTLTRALNAQLPADVRVTQIAEVDASFHARFSARSKTYRYQMRAGVVGLPFDRLYVWELAAPLDVAAMREAARRLIGTHDFTAFQSAGSEARDAVRTMTRSELNEGPDGLLLYEVSGNGFLRHMVRAIVGTLVDVGRGWRTPAQVGALLHGGVRGAAGPTAPAHGLLLVRVDYD
jgi:tRNA pseudouridine38-40 synthase